MSRATLAQQPPPPDLDLAQFPTRTIPAGARWFRQHRASQGPWWFSSDGSGRFDLIAPAGTCYLADTAAATVRERVGPDLVAHGRIPAGLLAGRVVSRLALPAQVCAAELDNARAALFRVTRELAVMTPYDVPQRWAAAFAAAGFAALRTVLRFSPGRAHGLALFGPAGEAAGWPVDPSPTSARSVAHRIGLTVVDPPRLDQLRVLDPRR